MSYSAPQCLNGCIQCDDVCVEFGNVLVLDEVSFSIPRGVLTGVAVSYTHLTLPTNREV